MARDPSPWPRRGAHSPPPGPEATSPTSWSRPSTELPCPGRRDGRGCSLREVAPGRLGAPQAAGRQAGGPAALRRAPRSPASSQGPTVPSRRAPSARPPFHPPGSPPHPGCLAEPQGRSEPCAPSGGRPGRQGDAYSLRWRNRAACLAGVTAAGARSALWGGCVASSGRTQ